MSRGFVVGLVAFHLALLIGCPLLISLMWNVNLIPCAMAGFAWLGSIVSARRWFKLWAGTRAAARLGT